MYSLRKSEKFPHGTLVIMNTEPAFQYRDALNYKLKQIDEIAAVFPAGTASDDSDDNDDTAHMYCDFFVDGVLSYSLRRNGYYPPRDCLIEFFKDSEGRVLFIFSKHHGELSVCDAKTGSELFSEEQDDKFCVDCQMVNQRYMLFSGWMWSPVYFKTLYDMDEFLHNKEEYEPKVIDGDSALRPHFSVRDGKLYSEKLDESFDAEYVYNNISVIENSITAPAYLQYVNKVKTSNNLLKCLLGRGTLSPKNNDSNDDHVRFETAEAQEALSLLISDARLKSIRVKGTGKVSGADMTDRYKYSLFRPIKYTAKHEQVGEYRENFTMNDSIKCIVPKVFFNFLGRWDSQEECSDGFVKHIVDIHLLFEITFVMDGSDSIRTLIIEIDQDMKEMICDQSVSSCAGTGEVDENFPCEVKMRCIADDSIS